LDNSRYASNTIIVLWSDNGWHFGEKRTWRKFTLWQESTKVPLIFVPVGSTKGAVCERPVQLIDIYPTLVKLCNLPGPNHNLEGNDLSALIADPQMEWKHPALTTNGRSSHALTSEYWKYIRFFDGSEELYNLKKDPFCWTNLAENKLYDQVKKELSEFFPVVNLPNGPGSLYEMWDRDYPDVPEKLKKIREVEKKYNIKILY
jgi:choline-sulfatase